MEADDPPGRLYHIYCDESCTDKPHTCMVFGGIILPVERVHQIEQAMAEWRSVANMHAELKWAKITSNKFANYADLVRMTMRHVRQREMLFRSIVFDRCHIDYRGFWGRDHRQGFYGLMRIFVLNAFMRRIFAGDRVILFIDKRNSQYPLGRVKDWLNQTAREKFGWNVDAVRQVQVIDSKKSCVMQMNDVLLGAVGHQMNQLDKVEGCRPAKKDIASLVAEEAGLENLRRQTPREVTHFGIWKFAMKNRRHPPKKEHPDS